MKENMKMLFIQLVLNQIMNYNIHLDFLFIMYLIYYLDGNENWSHR